MCSFLTTTTVVGERDAKPQRHKKFKKFKKIDSLARNPCLMIKTVAVRACVLTCYGREEEEEERERGGGRKARSQFIHTYIPSSWLKKVSLILSLSLSLSLSLYWDRCIYTFPHSTYIFSCCHLYLPISAITIEKENEKERYQVSRDSKDIVGSK